MKGQAIIYHTDGSITTTELTASPDLEFLQQAVGGHIEVVPYFDRLGDKPCVAFCNEEGKLKGLPINTHATLLWGDAVGVQPNDVLCGDVLVITGDKALLNSL
jgi:hypothetical protein